MRYRRSRASVEHKWDSATKYSTVAYCPAFLHRNLKSILPERLQTGRFIGDHPRFFSWRLQVRVLTDGSPSLLNGTMGFSGYRFDRLDGILDHATAHPQGRFVMPPTSTQPSSVGDHGQPEHPSRWWRSNTWLRKQLDATVALSSSQHAPKGAARPQYHRRVNRLITRPLNDVTGINGALSTHSNCQTNGRYDSPRSPFKNRLPASLSRAGHDWALPDSQSRQT